MKIKPGLNEDDDWSDIDSIQRKPNVQEVRKIERMPPSVKREVKDFDKLVEDSQPITEDMFRSYSQTPEDKSETSYLQKTFRTFALWKSQCSTVA